MVNQEEFVIIYHPKCKASQNLLSKIQQDTKGVKLVNILTLESIPPQIQSVPVGIIKGTEIINGKELFEHVENIIVGPSSFNVYGSSNRANFVGSNTDFAINSNFSQFGENSELDGTQGVPDFDESKCRTISELEAERS